jgi:microcystin-dependent protein
MEPFVGEIITFAGNFAPRGYAFCEGQLLAVSQNDALFSLIGTIYGGDGRTTFGLPDLRGRTPLGQGQGPGLSERRLGSKGGVESVTLTENQMPTHGHGGAPPATNNPAISSSPEGNVLAKSLDEIYGEGTSSTLRLAPSSTEVSAAGGSRSHNNMPPFLALNYCIALVGIYPSRN